MAEVTTCCFVALSRVAGECLPFSPSFGYVSATFRYALASACFRGSTGHCRHFTEMLPLRFRYAEIRMFPRLNGAA